MVFLPIILLGLGLAFGYFSYQKSNRLMRMMAVSFLLAALGTGIISYFAFMAVN